MTVYSEIDVFQCHVCVPEVFIQVIHVFEYFFLSIQIQYYHMYKNKHCLNWDIYFPLAIYIFAHVYHLSMWLFCQWFAKKLRELAYPFFFLTNDLVWFLFLKKKYCWCTLFIFYLRNEIDSMYVLVAQMWIRIISFFSCDRCFWRCELQKFPT